MKTPTSPIPPFKLERYFARWEFVAPYNLCASDVEGYALSELLTLADPETRALWDGLVLGYTESPGHPLVRDEIAKLYASVTRDDVLCFTGAEEAIYITMRVLVGPGDHVIVAWPGYQSLYQIAQAIGADVSLLPLRPVGGAWTIDLDELHAMIRSTTKLIITNFPHNPTGALLGRTGWEQIIRLAQDVGCYLFSDEVYRLLEYDEADRLSAAADGYEKALSLGVMSKPFGLAGLRLGWIATRDHELLSQIAAYKDYTTICNSAPSEILALIGLRAKEQVLARCLGIIQTNLALLDTFIHDHAEAFEWIRPRAGSIAFPKWRGAVPIERFTDALVQSEGVLLLPATVFDYPDNHFRIGLGRTNMTESLQRLGRFVRQLGGSPG